MERNVGKKESVIRMLIGIVLVAVVVLGFQGSLDLRTSYLVVMAILGTILLVTGATKRCPLYKIIDKSTS